MATYNLLYIGDKPEKCLPVMEGIKVSEEDSVNLIDISNMKKSQIFAIGAAQGVIYFNDIYENSQYLNKLQFLINNQSEKGDLSLFSLSDVNLTTQKEKMERKILAGMFSKRFPDINSEEVAINHGPAETEEDLLNFASSIIQVQVNGHLDNVHEVELNSNQKMEMLINVIEEAMLAKHSYTLGHCLRVATLVEAMSEQLGLPKEKQEEVVLAAKLHDIGKFLTPQQVLAKKSSLSMAERDTMDLHTIEGRNSLLSLIEKNAAYAEKITPEVIKGVENHHKFWNGMHGRFKGDEPDPINGDEIGEYALIIGVMDSIDAMVSQRAYNNPKHALDMFRDLYQNRGKQFKKEYAEEAIILFCKEFASLGIDPLKLVPDISPNTRNQEIDDGLKNFLEANSDKFKVNYKAKPGEYSKLGFRLDDKGYFEFLDPYSIKRDPAIREADERNFLLGKFAQGGNLEDVTKDENIVAKVEEAVAKKFAMQDLEGEEAMKRAKTYMREYPTIQGLGAEIFAAAKYDMQYNYNLYGNSIKSVQMALDPRGIVR